MPWISRESDWDYTVVGTELVEQEYENVLKVLDQFGRPIRVASQKQPIGFKLQKRR